LIGVGVVNSGLPACHEATRRSADVVELNAWA
jgi:hypothetical protein